MVELEQKPQFIPEIQSPTPLEIPRDRRGRIRWGILKRDPEKLIAVIEQEVFSFISEGNELTNANLAKLGPKGIARAVQRYYPDSLLGVSRKMRRDISRVPNKYWAQSEATDIIRTHALDFYQQNGAFSRTLLREKNETRLISAIGKKYPGGWRQIQIDIGFNSSRKPNRYWTEENIEREAVEFYGNEGALDRKTLKTKKRQDLLGAIQRRYQGSFTKLRIKLGFELGKKNQYWTTEQIEKEVLQVYEQTGRISWWHLQTLGRSDLLHAITDHYPGRLKALKEKFGMLDGKKSISPEEANEDLDRLLEE